MRAALAVTLTASVVSSASLAPTAIAQFPASPQTGAQKGARAGSVELKPVAPIRSTPQPLAGSAIRSGATASTARESATLRWQSSSQVATEKSQQPPAVARVAYLQDDLTRSADGSANRGGVALSAPADPFTDPFNDGHLVPPAVQSQPEQIAVPREGRFIGELVPPNTGNSVLETDEPQAAAEPGRIVQDNPAADPPSGQLQIPNPFSPGEASKERDPAQDRATIPSPSDQQSVVQEPDGGELRDRNERAVDSGRRPSQRVEPSCDELRERIARRTIRKVTLDISPPFRPDVLEQDEYAELWAEFVESQEIRQWRGLDGRLLGSGRLIDMAYENAIVATENGEELSLPMAELSEPDLEYVTSAWGLPRECQLPQVDFQPRQWLPIKMTWKASELCHKPLYFEEVNLERYGHTAGPFAQPVISTAHFFFNIAVLPYKMGIHPPNECQYALGYYRPGNCAPWIVPPVPLSLRGALAETAFVGGMVALVP